MESTEKKKELKDNAVIQALVKTLKGRFVERVVDMSGGDKKVSIIIVGSDAEEKSSQR